MCLRAHNAEMYITAKIYLIDKISLVFIIMDKVLSVFCFFSFLTKLPWDAKCKTLRITVLNTI
jgi:hypothetical protein